MGDAAPNIHTRRGPREMPFLVSVAFPIPGSRLAWNLEPMSSCGCGISHEVRHWSNEGGVLSALTGCHS